MADLGDLRCRHAAFIFALRTVRERFGQEGVDLLAERHRQNIIRAYAKKAADLGASDLDAFVSTMTLNPATHTRRVLRRRKGLYEMKITRCAHAELFAEWNARDLGCQFVCAGDDAMLEGFNPQIQLRRPKLLMNGDDCCHFVYTRPLLLARRKRVAL